MRCKYCHSRLTPYERQYNKGMCDPCEVNGPRIKKVNIPAMYEDIEPLDEDGHHNILFFGNWGTGKTYKAIQILRSWSNGKEPCEFITAVDAWKKRCAMEPDEKENFDDDMEYWELLVLDDVTKIAKTEAAFSWFNNLIINRDANMKKTILTCNGTKQEVENVLGGAIIDRFRKGAVEFTGESYRK